MLSVLKSNLGRRIILLVSVSMLLILVALGISGSLAIEQSEEQVAGELRELAQVTGAYLEHVLRQNLEQLDDIRFAQGFNMEDDNMEPERRALHSIYLGSIFDNGVFITDGEGTVLTSEPLVDSFVGSNISDYPPVSYSLINRRPSISNIFAAEPTGKMIIAIVTPLRNTEGKLVGLIGGTIDPVLGTLEYFTDLGEEGETSHICIIDGNGIVLASSDPQRILQVQKATHSQGEPEISELAPLSLAPWSVLVSQSEEEALAPVHTMEQRFLLIGIPALFVASFLSWAMALSVIKPIKRLNVAAQSIARGDLSQPTPELGSDEIGELSRNFDTMRMALNKSLAEIQKWNVDLEAKVVERTRQLEDSYHEIERKEAARGELLRKLLTVQEEERRRIARELHDETTQSLVGLLMRLEAAGTISTATSVNISELLADVRKMTIDTLDNVHRIIFDLRPSVLDDLGLLAAIRLFAKTHLEGIGVKARVELTGESRALPPQTEIALFRIVQEAINNIARHAEAHNVVISVEFDKAAIIIEVEDDGKGFEVEAVSSRVDKVFGLGLLGMQERVEILGGRFQIESNTGGGTRLVIEVPLH